MADFIILSTADWDHPLWTNKQHTARALAAAGHRVLYVESLGLRGLRPERSDLVRIFKRLIRILRVPRHVSENVWICSPMVIPGATSGILLKLNRRLLGLSLSIAKYCLGFKKSVLWTYNPLTKKYLSLRQYCSTIYHCVDRVQAQPGMPEALIEPAERELCQSVDIVFVTSPELHASLKPWNQNTYFFGNVADTQHFSKARLGKLDCPLDLREISHPRLIFVGAIDAYKIDIPLLVKLAQATSCWNYILIGPVGLGDPSTDIQQLQSCENVHLLGYRPYGELPAWLAHADVALLPMRVNDYTRNMFPMKFFEYLSAGLPVVATRIPSLQSHADIAHLCEPSLVGLQQAIQEALAGQGASLDVRLKVANEHTYDHRTRQMMDILQENSLLPVSGPTFLRPVLLIGKPSHLSAGLLERMMSKFAVRFSLGLGSLMAPRQAASLLESWSRLWPRNPLILQSLTLCYLRAGDYHEARRVIENLWELFGDLHQLHRLLFRRSARPTEPLHQIALFDVLGSSTRLPFSYCCYCLIVSAYRCIDMGHVAGMKRLRLSLVQVASDLENDPGTWTCDRENRVNRAKLLVSSYTTLSRLSLALGDFDGFAAIGLQASAFMDSFDLSAIDPDTSFRLTRNLMRTLAIEILESWRTHDMLRFDDARARLARVHVHCHLECFSLSLAQEDHRGFANNFLDKIDLIRPCLNDPAEQRADDQILGVLQLMLGTKQKSVDRIAHIFRPYLHRTGHPGLS